MDAYRIALIVLARRKIVLTILGATMLASLLISVIIPNTYRATSTIVLNSKGVDPVTGTAMSAQLMPAYTATQVDIIVSKSVALRVVDRLELADKAEYKETFISEAGGAGNIRDWIADSLVKKLKAIPAREGSVIKIQFSHANPEFAADASNAFASEYRNVDIHLKTELLKDASSYFNQQVAVLRNKLEAARSRVLKYQQENGIVSANDAVDVEHARLNELSTQLVEAQRRSLEASLRQREVEGDKANQSPDVLAFPLIQNLKASLAQAEANLKKLSSSMTHAHPHYQAAYSEVEQLRAQLDANTRAVSSSIVSNALVLKKQEADLSKAVEAQKIKVLELNLARGELAVLSKEVDSAQRAYDTTTERYIQTSLEGHANQSDVSILNPATVPTEPSSPRLLLNVLASILVGALLGVAMSVLAEMRDRRIRSASDIMDALPAPVLGVLKEDTPHSRFAFPERLLLINR